MQRERYGRYLELVVASSSVGRRGDGPRFSKLLLILNRTTGEVDASPPGLGKSWLHHPQLTRI